MKETRPLSPHLTIYKPQITSLLSICHRLCGMTLAMGSLLAVWWVVALASSPSYYAFVQNIMLSLFGQVVLFGFSGALFYHLSNGIRHIIWDFGYGLSLEGVRRGGYIVLAVSSILTIGLWVYICNERGAF